MKLEILLPVVILLSAGVAQASRQRAPIVPPGQAIKVTRADFKEKEQREAERENTLSELQEEIEQLANQSGDDAEQALAAKLAERQAAEAAIEAAREAERQELAQKKAQAPEDFVADVKKVVMSEAPKTASVHETVVQQAPIVTAAKKVVTRRSR